MLFGVSLNVKFFLSESMTFRYVALYAIIYDDFFLVENETRCFGVVGCLNITRQWYHLIHRPFNVFPLPRNVINTRFILYTENNPTDGQLLNAEDKDTITNSHFRPDRMTKFIIHGFIDTPLSSWVFLMKDELLKYSNQNQGEYHNNYCAIFDLKLSVIFFSNCR